jgi:hypothetical protein
VQHLTSQYAFKDFLAHATQIDAKADQGGRSDAFASHHKAKKHVLGADVAVAELERLAAR